MSTRKTKPYEQLDFTDDFMFSKIMRTEPEICKKIIEICIGKKSLRFLIRKHKKQFRLLQMQKVSDSMFMLKMKRIRYTI